MFELGHHADWSRIVWCAHFGDDTVNFTGTGQGGAIAAVFDIALTMAATSFFQQAPEAEGGKPDAYCVTVSLPACRRRSSLGGVLTPTPAVLQASLSTQFKKPVTPIPGVFRVEIWSEGIDGRRITGEHNPAQ